ncbi:PD40 domain-containing protein [Hyphobacterium sp. CCMP332]|nr:PD40 domain-containing protein [Hyphobacterium sp. CCMP332]
MRIILLLNLLLIYSTKVFSQNPNTDIYIAEYSFDNGNFELNGLYNFTNRVGYDNQPFFHPENKWLYYSSIRNDGQSEVYRFEWENQKTYKVTQSYEDEFSPQLIPGRNSFSTVRVEFNQKQRLWSFDILNPEMPEVLFPEIERVGYSAWMDDDNLALFIVSPDEQSHELMHIKVANKEVKKVDSHIGRGFAVRPESNELLYVSKKDSSNWVLNLYSPSAESPELIAKALNSSDDYCWLNFNLIISGKGKAFYILDITDNKKEWISVLNLNDDIIGSIERIAIQPKYKRLAFVVNKKQ